MKDGIKRERYRLLHSVQRLLEVPMILLGFVWLILLVAELIWGLPKYLEYISLAIWIIFLADFLLKFILAPKKISFLKKNWLTAFSLLIPALRIFRLARVFRLLRGLRGIRLIRVVSSINRSMNSLGKTMQRRGFSYVVVLTLVVTFGGAAGMFAIEQENEGFTSYGTALWWTAMRVITAGSEAYPVTTEGRSLAFLIAMYGYAVFGYVTASLASFFIGRDAEEKETIAAANDIKDLKKEISTLTTIVVEMRELIKKDEDQVGRRRLPE